MTQQGTEQRIALLKKIQAITDEIGVIEKDGYNKHSKYRFPSHEAIDARLTPLLSKKNLFINPNVQKVDEEAFQSQSGGTMVRTRTTMGIAIIDLDTGYSEKYTWSGADNDKGGKSLGQSITECLKRFEIKLFRLSSKDDKDPDAHTEGISDEDILADYHGLPYQAKLNRLEQAFTNAGMSFANAVVNCGTDMDEVFTIEDNVRRSEILGELEQKIGLL